MRSALRIDSGRAALLLVDLQEEQRSDPLYASADIETVLNNACRLLHAARGNGITVFHAGYRRDYAACPPRPFEPRSTGGAAMFSDKDSPLTRICAEVAPVGGEIVIYKNDASAFGETVLGHHLNERGIEWLIIAGVWTEACVAATVRDAMAQGFRVLIVKDACGSGTATMHQTAILNLANRLYGGAVADTDRATALLEGAEATVWRCERPVPILFNLEDIGHHYASL